MAPHLVHRPGLTNGCQQSQQQGADGADSSSGGAGGVAGAAGVVGGLELGRQQQQRTQLVQGMQQRRETFQQHCLHPWRWCSPLTTGWTPFQLASCRAAGILLQPQHSLQVMQGVLYAMISSRSSWTLERIGWLCSCVAGTPFVSCA